METTQLLQDSLDAVVEQEMEPSVEPCTYEDFGMIEDTGNDSAMHRPSYNTNSSQMDLGTCGETGCEPSNAYKDDAKGINAANHDVMLQHIPLPSSPLAGIATEELPYSSNLTLPPEGASTATPNFFQVVGGTIKRIFLGQDLAGIFGSNHWTHKTYMSCMQKMDNGHISEVEKAYPAAVQAVDKMGDTPLECLVAAARLATILPNTLVAPKLSPLVLKQLAKFDKMDYNGFSHLDKDAHKPEYLVKRVFDEFLKQEYEQVTCIDSIDKNNKNIVVSLLALWIKCGLLQRYDIEVKWALIQELTHGFQKTTINRTEADLEHKEGGSTSQYNENGTHQMIQWLSKTKLPPSVGQCLIALGVRDMADLTIAFEHLSDQLKEFPPLDQWKLEQAIQKYKEDPYGYDDTNHNNMKKVFLSDSNDDHKSPSMSI